MVPLRGGQVGEIVEDLDRGIRVGLPEADPSAQCRGDLHVEQVRDMEVGFVSKPLPRTGPGAAAAEERRDNDRRVGDDHSAGRSAPTASRASAKVIRGEVTTPRLDRFVQAVPADRGYATAKPISSVLRARRVRVGGFDGRCSRTVGVAGATATTSASPSDGCETDPTSSGSRPSPTARRGDASRSEQGERADDRGPAGALTRVDDPGRPPRSAGEQLGEPGGTGGLRHDVSTGADGPAEQDWTVTIRPRIRPSERLGEGFGGCTSLLTWGLCPSRDSNPEPAGNPRSDGAGYGDRSDAASYLGESPLDGAGRCPLLRALSE